LINSTDVALSHEWSIGKALTFSPTMRIVEWQLIIVVGEAVGLYVVVPLVHKVSPSAGALTIDEAMLSVDVDTVFGIDNATVVGLALVRDGSVPLQWLAIKSPCYGNYCGSCNQSTFAMKPMPAPIDELDVVCLLQRDHDDRNQAWLDKLARVSCVTLDCDG